MSAFDTEPIAANVADADSTAAFSARAATRRIGVAPPRDREQAFATARRRSARVRRLRRAILIGGLGTVAAMFLTAFFNPFATRLGSLGFSPLSVEGTKIVMDHPKLAGFRNDGQAYLMTAKRALQDIKQPTVMELEKVEGEIGAANGESTHVTADSGVYDSLGDAYMADGQKELARQSSKKALELLTTNTSYNPATREAVKASAEQKLKALGETAAK